MLVSSLGVFVGIVCCSVRVLFVRGGSLGFAVWRVCWWLLYDCGGGCCVWWFFLFSYVCLGLLNSVG